MICPVYVLHEARSERAPGRLAANTEDVSARVHATLVSILEEGEECMSEREGMG